MQAKRTFQDLTIVSVTGAADYIQGSIYAIMRSCQELPGAKGLLISPPLPKDVHLPANIEHQLIAPFGYLEYNLFILYQLDYFIHTDFCLIVQNDGWVINGKNWRDEFWDYDYIGAPIPVFGQHDTKIFNLSHTEFYFNNLHLIQDPNYFVPQNGGFSLRSKRLLGMPRKLNIPNPIEPPLPVEAAELEAGKPYKMQWEHSFHHEDMFLTGRFRPHFEHHGIRFAPHELALFFALETTSIHFIHKIPLDQVMGAHWCGAVIFAGENYLEIHLNERTSQYTDKELQESPDLQLLIQAGYKIDILRK